MLLAGDRRGWGQGCGRSMRMPPLMQAACLQSRLKSVTAHVKSEHMQTFMMVFS